MSAPPGRRTLLLLALTLPLCPADADDPASTALPLVLDTLAAAKSKAEDAVHIVNLYVSDSPTIQVEAMQNYSHARSAFNGLIESLITERDPDAAVAPLTETNSIRRDRHWIHS